MERAERLANLINQGQCRTAYETAVAENDPVMAHKVLGVCTGPQSIVTVTDPEPAD